MASGDLASKTIAALRVLLGEGSVSPRDILEDLLSRIARLNPSLRAYLAVDPDRLRRQADELMRTSRRGRLWGIPVTIKDNICVMGEETCCASRILQGFRSPYDATVIARLREEGALILPRTNMDEFAFGSSTENSAFGPTKNPRTVALDRVPGGSSGGSAAAVAANLAISALGSDTGGSIRQPAAFCGVVGLKPTYGRVSRYGLVAFASSLDQIGPLTKDARDAAMLLSVIAGHDPRDSTSAPVEVPDYEAALAESPRELTIGLPTLSTEGLDAQVRQAIEQATEVFKGMGLKTVMIDLPTLDWAVATYYIIATAEASSNLARYDGVQYGWRASLGSGFGVQGSGQGPSSAPDPEPPTQNPLLEMYLRTRTEGFGAEAKRRILLGTYVLSHGYYDAYYLKGMKVRTLITQDFDAAFRRCDVIVMPTTPTPAFRLGEKLEDPLQMYLSDIYTISANLAGIPALSVCCGTTPEGLPIGMQLLASPFQEARLLQLAHAYERETPWATRRAQLYCPA
ncbi:MAG: Asp-tRNA(Asn)/Glu-tRNA(Gln) amidotransferase subunit GatA [Candidatus Omnitrophica bacterium]|nr:Asp-tRNA(Asn)/Glu-tRNA(Gln) amidotransferase subunit GatA [Candidatus Omnitrophota bacterium]